METTRRLGGEIELVHYAAFLVTRSATGLTSLNRHNHRLPASFVTDISLPFLWDRPG